MKFQCSFLLFLPFTLFAQIGVNPKIFKGFQALKGDYLYISETEITNGQYKEFLNSLKADGHISAYIRNLPDTTVWRKNMSYCEPFVAYYFQHPAYSDYPVVGITQNQALEWCRWYAEKLVKSEKIKEQGIQKVIVRLPGTTEWEMAARGILGQKAIYPWDGESLRISEGKKRDIGKMRLNCSVSKNDDVAFPDGGLITVPAYAYWPNTIGLYNMCGNVAEWVAEPARTKGGAWNSLPYNCRIDATGAADGDSTANAWTGFRPVIEIEKWDVDQPKAKPLFVKGFEKEFGYVDTQLYATYTEVTNAMYSAFISDENTDTSHIPTDHLWAQFDPYAYRKSYSTSAAFWDYPVVNITYQSAVAFCEWMTREYHKMPNRKFNKVQFRLPTEAEWIQMASAGKSRTYPWGGPYTRNSKGCFLANYYPKPESRIASDQSGHSMLLPHDTSGARSADGAEFTTKVDAYFPNDYGFYNAAGNVAEMLSEEGIAKGGSWNSDAYYLKTTGLRAEGDKYIPYSNAQKYSGPSPEIGFRVFMEIINP